MTVPLSLNNNHEHAVTWTNRLTDCYVRSCCGNFFSPQISRIGFAINFELIGAVTPAFRTRLSSMSLVRPISRCHEYVMLYACIRNHAIFSPPLLDNRVIKKRPWENICNYLSTAFKLSHHRISGSYQFLHFSVSA